MSSLKISRRQLLTGVGALTVFGATGSAVYFAAVRKSQGAVELTAAEIESISALCDAIIPATDTGGALAAGVVTYIRDLFARDTESARRGFKLGLATLNAEIARRPHDDDLAAILSAILAQSDRTHPSPSAGFLRQIKRSTMIGYYTSEVGASQELDYVPVPGPFKPDIPVTPATRAFSNDTGALL